VLPDTDGPAKIIRSNVYKFTISDSSRYANFQENLCVWFTGRTTGIEAHPALYSCAIPRKEDFVDIALRVGEMKYHD
jgi:hypothetical protein